MIADVRITGITTVINLTMNNTRFQRISTNVNDKVYWYMKANGQYVTDYTLLQGEDAEQAEEMYQVALEHNMVNKAV